MLESIKAVAALETPTRYQPRSSTMSRSSIRPTWRKPDRTRQPATCRRRWMEPRTAADQFWSAFWRAAHASRRPRDGHSAERNEVAPPHEGPSLKPRNYTLTHQRAGGMLCITAKWDA